MPLDALVVIVGSDVLTTPVSKIISLPLLNLSGLYPKSLPGSPGKVGFTFGCPKSSFLISGLSFLPFPTSLVGFSSISTV